MQNGSMHLQNQHQQVISSTRSGNMSPKTCKKNLLENNELRHIKPMPSPWGPTLPISWKLEIFISRLCLSCAYPTHVNLQTNQQVLVFPHCRNPITVRHILATWTFHNRLTQKLQFPESYEDIFLPTHMDEILKFTSTVNFIPERS